MTDYILETVSIPPLSKKKPEQIIILCHGYGGDGNDISTLAINWQRFLPDAIFLSPNAPEVCAVNPQGYQWFDLTSDKEEIILEKSLAVEEKLNKYLDEVLNNFQLKPDNLALVGFSQGCMIGIQTVIKKKKKINCFIGYSGKIINQKHLANNGLKIKTKIFKNCEHKIPVEGSSLGLKFLKKNLL